MNVCFPITADQGLDSPVSGHFGSAPLYLLVETETRVTRSVVNGHAEHEHGACRPLEALSGEKVDAMVVGGIGPGALMKLQGAGIRVFRGTAPTVAACLDAFLKNEVEEIGPGGACGRHGHHHQGPDRQRDLDLGDAGRPAGLPTRG